MEMHPKLSLLPSCSMMADESKVSCISAAVLLSSCKPCRADSSVVRTCLGAMMQQRSLNTLQEKLYGLAVIHLSGGTHIVRIALVQLYRVAFWPAYASASPERVLCPGLQDYYIMLMQRLEPLLHHTDHVCR